MIAWPVGREGRKWLAGAAIFGARGELCAVGRQSATVVGSAALAAGVLQLAEGLRSSAWTASVSRCSRGMWSSSWTPVIPAIDFPLGWT